MTPPDHWCAAEEHHTPANTATIIDVASEVAVAEYHGHEGRGGRGTRVAQAAIQRALEVVEDALHSIPVRGARIFHKLADIAHRFGKIGTSE